MIKEGKKNKQILNRSNQDDFWCRVYAFDAMPQFALSVTILQNDKSTNRRVKTETKK